MALGQRQRLPWGVHCVVGSGASRVKYFISAAGDNAEEMTVW